MDNAQFDRITSSLAETTSRRGALRFIGAAIGVGSLTLLGQDATEARRKGRRRKNKNKNTNQQPVPGTSQTSKALREICLPGQDTCSAGLQCGAPTTRHTCSDTVEGIDAWCCVPPGGRCTECDCCGDYYCAYDDNNVPMCVPNPEG